MRLGLHSPYVCPGICRTSSSEYKNGEGTELEVRVTGSDKNPNLR